MDQTDLSTFKQRCWIDVEEYVDLWLPTSRREITKDSTVILGHVPLSYCLTSQLDISILYSVLHMTLHKCFVICTLLLFYCTTCENTELYLPKWRHYIPPRPINKQISKKNIQLLSLGLQHTGIQLDHGAAKSGIIWCDLRVPLHYSIIFETSLHSMLHKYVATFCQQRWDLRVVHSQWHTQWSM